MNNYLAHPFAENANVHIESFYFHKIAILWYIKRKSEVPSPSLRMLNLEFYRKFYILLTRWGGMTSALNMYELIMKNFYLFRHGETDWNKERRIQGHTDNPLNEAGIRQALELIPLLTPKNLGLILSSTLQRAKATGMLIAEALNIPLKEDSRLVEVDLGDYDGFYFDQVAPLVGENYLRRYLTSWLDADMDLVLKGGETKRNALQRVMTALTDAAVSEPAENIGIACHGLVMMLVLGYTGADRTYPMGNGDIVHLTWDGRVFNFTDYTENPQKTRPMF